MRPIDSANLSTNRNSSRPESTSRGNSPDLRDRHQVHQMVTSAPHTSGSSRHRDQAGVHHHQGKSWVSKKRKLRGYGFPHYEPKTWCTCDRVLTKLLGGVVTSTQFSQEWVCRKVVVRHSINEGGVVTLAIDIEKFSNSLSIIQICISFMLENTNVCFNYSLRYSLGFTFMMYY